jgi:catechol 2,3-dioxygenase
MTFTPPAPQLLPDETKLGPVHLSVTEGERAKLFWTEYVGLTELPSADGSLRLGAGEDELIVLHPGAASPVRSRHTGLYHVAIHLPARKDLARVVARLFALHHPNSPTDHAETEATYFSDPDGNGIELTFETPERGELTMVGGQPVARMADGSLQDGVAALDVESLLSELSEEEDLRTPMPAGTRIGHVHVHVRDIDEAVHFYEQVLGFGPHLNMEQFRMADFSLKTSFVPHAFAINTWQGAGASPKPEDAAGLRHWTLQIPDEEAVREIEGRLSAADRAFTQIPSGVELADPSGNPVRIITAPRT